MSAGLRSLLVVESNPADAYLTAETLKKAGIAHRVTVIEDGEQALAHLESAPAPDIVCLDLNLNVISGLEVLRKIRADPKLRTIPVVILSGSLNARDVRECYAQGANCYITKPSTLEEYLRIMQVFCDFWGSVATLPPRQA